MICWATFRPTTHSHFLTRYLQLTIRANKMGNTGRLFSLFWAQLSIYTFRGGNDKIIISSENGFTRKGKSLLPMKQLLLVPVRLNNFSDMAWSAAEKQNASHKSCLFCKTGGWFAKCTSSDAARITRTAVKLQWLEHLWDHGNFFRGTGSSSHWGLIMTPGQKANGDNLGNVFRSSRQ